MSDMVLVCRRRSSNDISPIGVSCCCQAWSRPSISSALLPKSATVTHTRMINPKVSTDLLAGIITFCLCLGCGLDTLAIDTARRRLFLAPLSLALLLRRCLHHLLPDAVSTPAIEVAIHRFPATERRRQHIPLAPRLGHTEDPVEDDAHRAGRTSRTTGTPFAGRQQRLQALPLRVGQVCRIWGEYAFFKSFLHRYRVLRLLLSSVGSGPVASSQSSMRATQSWA